MSIVFIIPLFLLIILNANLYPASGDTVRTINFNTALNSNFGNTVVAKVGGKKISVREFLCSYEFGPAFTKKEKDSKRKYLQYMINEKLLALDGYSRGFADSTKVKDLLSAIQGDISSEEMFKDDILKKIEIETSEMNQAIGEEKFSYQVKWLFAPDADSLNYFISGLRNGISFDSLFSEQLRDSVFADERSMEMDEFKLRTRNPEMFDVLDTMKAGEISKPVKGPDGWYILKLVDIWKNAITTETELEKETYDAKRALIMQKSDSLSDVYVRKLMLEYNPVIQARPFDILRSYLGKAVLPKDKFQSWKLDDRMQKELNYFDSLKANDFKNMTLVKLDKQSLTLSDFLNWYNLRDEYLKFDETSFNSFSASLEKFIWRMVRDHLLVQSAYRRGYQNEQFVKEQTDWWRDKIIYSVVRDEIGKSIGLNIETPMNPKGDYADKKQDFINKTFRKLQQLKKKYKIEINEKVLNEIKVQDTNDPKAIDVYTVRKGGTFPHPVYPSIDFEWRDWE